jgi:hypothetical protein
MASVNARMHAAQFNIIKKHFCPTCDKPVKLTMHMPGRAMWGDCESGHSHPKRELILK